MGFIVWAGIYARKEGFTRSWRGAIEGEFAKRGYHVEIGKLTLGAFRGLVAEDVLFFQDATRKQEIAVLDDVFLDVDLSKVFDKKQISINTLDVQDAKLSLPLDRSKPGGRRLRVEGLSGRVVITESVIEIVKAEATMAGLDLAVKGSLVRPPRDRIEETPPEEEDEPDVLAERRQQLLRVLRELDKFDFADERPRIEVEFRGDLDDISTISAKAKIETRAFRRKEQAYAVESLSGRMEFKGRSNRAEIEELVVRDEEGEASIAGAWSKETGRFDFAIESNADLSSLVGMLWQDKRMGEIVFFRPPEVAASGHLSLAALAEGAPGFPGEVIGEFHAERFGTRGTVFAGLDFGFSVSGERFYLRNLRLDHKTGVAFLNLKYEPGQEKAIRYQTEIKLDPMVFRPFFQERGRKFLDAWNFSEASTVYLAGMGEGGSWDTGTWQNKGVIDLRHFRLNGVPFLEMEAEVETDGSLQWFRGVSLVRDEGEIVAETAKHDLETRQWEVEGVVSTVDLVEGSRAFNPKLAESLSRYRLSKPPTVRLSGVLDGRRDEEVANEARRNAVDISFTTEGSTEYDFLGKTLSLKAPAGKVRIDGSRVHLTSMTSGAFGGMLELDYDSRDVRSPDKPFAATVRIGGVPLEAVTRLYGDTEEVTGQVETVFDVSGNAGDVSSFNGRGSAAISNGQLFALPVLGPLSKLVARANPAQENAGHSVAREARATFAIANGVLHTEDIEALTDSFSVRGAGSVSLDDSSVDLEAVVNTRDGLTRAILTPVSELLTYACSGTVQEPVWKPKHISNLGKLPARVISEMTSVPVEGLRMIGQGLFGPGRDGRGPDENEAEEDPPRRGLFQRRTN